jgi:telomerase reverse transcriptase
MGSSMFSIDEMYHRIKAFRTHLNKKCLQGRKLYFAKVDVKACFDTIPQSSLLRLLGVIMAEEEYRVDKYVEVCPPPSHQVPNKFGVKRPVKKFIAQARPGDEIQDFGEFAETMVEKLKPATVLVDNVVGKAWDRSDLMDLLEEHIQENIIKVGKKYFRQKKGIPQGSILSSILCNFFYAELEREKLSFISEDCLLLRLIDDFLYITLDKDKAKKFLQTMHNGNPEYGAFVNPEKSLVNFETTINSKKVQQLVGTMEFPYCGNVVHTKTLDIRRDRGRKNLTSKSTTNPFSCLAV